MRYPRASDEPLEIIRMNECDAGDASLTTKRFQALWNEIERLREALQAIADGDGDFKGDDGPWATIARRALDQPTREPHEKR